MLTLHCYTIQIYEIKKAESFFESIRADKQIRFMDNSEKYSWDEVTKVTEIESEVRR